MSKAPSVEVRDWIYTASLIASAVVGVLISTGLVTQLVGTSIDKLIGAVSVAAAGGPALAKLMLARQRRDRTLDFSGSAVEQATQSLQAAQAEAEQKRADADAAQAELDRLLDMAASVSTTPPTGDLMHGHGPGR